MYKLYEAGFFGNKLKTWSDIPSFLEDDFSGEIVLRYSGQSGGGWVAYGIRPDQIDGFATRWKEEGADPSLIKVSESAPDERLTIQGEVSEIKGEGLVLVFSTFKGKMRDAMKFAERVDGVSALVTLRDYLSPSSYEDVRELLDIFPSSVVEFSAYEMFLGDCQGRNTIIWEVRNY